MIRGSTVASLSVVFAKSKTCSVIPQHVMLFSCKIHDFRERHFFQFVRRGGAMQAINCSKLVKKSHEPIFIFFKAPTSRYMDVKKEAESSTVKYKENQSQKSSNCATYKTTCTKQQVKTVKIYFFSFKISVCKNAGH